MLSRIFAYRMYVYIWTYWNKFKRIVVLECRIGSSFCTQFLFYKRLQTYSHFVPEHTNMIFMRAYFFCDNLSVQLCIITPTSRIIDIILLQYVFLYWPIIAPFIQDIIKYLMDCLYYAHVLFANHYLNYWNLLNKK